MPTKKKATLSRTKKPAAAPKSKLPKKKSLKANKKMLAAPRHAGEARLLSSEIVYHGPLFRVTKDRILEPGGKESTRDVVRHNGSVIILAVDSSKSKRDPWIVMERQYRHAAGRFLWELPAGKLEPGEDALAGAQRELEEETGYRAKRWKPLVEYFASPGFLGETMKVFLAEGLVSGDAHPEEDEDIELRLIKLSDILKQIEKGAIMDGKTLSCVLLYARLKGNKKK
jgi:ADP-ribose pyrophosphatase